MNMELAHRCQMLPEKLLNSRTLAITALLRSGWSKQLVERDIDQALAWAKSQRLTVKQERYRRTRQARKLELRDDDALDQMFLAVGADPNAIPRKPGKGNAAGQMAVQSQGQATMALGLNYSSGGGGDIIPFVKYDARAGRFFRRDRTEQGGQYVSNDVDITNAFKAVIDLENVEVGYMKFGNGSAPEMLLVKLGDPMPHRPADPGFKQGARVMMKLHSSCGGDVRECSSSAAAFLKGMDDLHTQYEAEKATNAGKLPVIALQTTMPITSGSGQKKSTNYQPVFEIVAWVPRPADLVHVPKVSAQKTETAPATGSTQVAPPPAAQQKVLETADNDFG